ncbi:MAG: ERF family protein [Mangrovimonas sp.]|nr:ERF family protein [Mangrovimonas sp.]
MESVSKNNGLYKKIINIQAKVLGIKKNQTGNTGKREYKYEDLNSIITMLHPYLSEAGLGIIHTVITDERGQYICQTIVFDQQDQVGVFCPIPDVSKALSSSNLMQGMGSAITYARRYNIKNIFNLFSTDDEAAILTTEPITEAQIKTLNQLLEKLDGVIDMAAFYEFVEAGSVPEMNKQRANQAISYLKKKVKNVGQTS